MSSNYKKDLVDFYRLAYPDLFSNNCFEGIAYDGVLADMEEKIVEHNKMPKKVYKYSLRSDKLFGDLTKETFNNLLTECWNDNAQIIKSRKMGMNNLRSLYIDYSINHAGAIA